MLTPCRIVIPQTPRVRVEKKDGKFIATVALEEVVSPPCVSEDGAVMQVLAARLTFLQEKEKADLDAWLK